MSALPRTNRPSSRASIGRIAFGDHYRSRKRRRHAWWWFWWTDHGWLRAYWHNLDEIAPGVWRSNQPSPARLKRYSEMGIGTILTLRGNSTKPHHVFERNCCAHFGIALVPIRLRARKLAEAQVYLDLLARFETLDRPFLMHCKSGADRAGLASALYLLHIENAPVDVAKKQLSFRYLHVRRFKTGVLDFMLDRYAEDIRENPMPIRDWLETRYDRRQIMQAYRAGGRQ